ncbi:hypothetical protein F3Y22_tig00111330pilonHSYRG00472 [Hibiscus syriacus]|uniref:Mitochondrial import inner membrane translocase subunit TIM50 n=1 Tax=Hibiscus syriacus TaxID=106335 RepID=A0A6A2YPU4_HIBSY|nr:hypothetical protein F3Y22_tig00111330pilonHSYRG00472 [Hibiscus syriacus]
MCHHPSVEEAWKLVKDVIGLEQEKEQMDPIGHEDDQPIGDAMMEDAPGREDVTIKTVIKYVVNFWEHIDSLVSKIRADIASLRDEVSIFRNELRQRHQTNDDITDDDDDDKDLNKYIVSVTPPTRKLVLFDVNDVLAYFSRNSKDVILRPGVYEFLHFCLENFVVAIWPSNIRHNIDCILQKLPLLSDQFLFIWDQGKCKTKDSVTHCKDLHDVWNVYPNFNAQNTLLVDDSDEK